MDTVVNKFIGQQPILEIFDLWKIRNAYPHFILIAGDEGSGRRSLAFKLAEIMDARITLVEDLSAGSVRNVIETSASIDIPMVYVFVNADGMSLASKNSLLKFTEEPPENAYIVMTLTKIENTLPTLQSRSQHLIVAPYTYDELMQICNNSKLCRIATTPGMLKRLQDMPEVDVDKMIETASKLVNYIHRVSLANAFKSASSIKFKESDRGFDFDIMMATIKCILSQVSNKLIDNPDRKTALLLSCWYRAFADWGYKFKYSGVNKRALYDQFIVDVRSRIGSVGV